MRHPGLASAWSNDGLVKLDLLDLHGAKTSFHRAIQLDPSNVPAHFNLGLALLMEGDFENGWREYAWRTRAPGYRDYANYPFGIPRWAGQALKGKSILVHAEQGFGDTIQFSRFLTWAADEGANVDLFCQPSLRPLLARVRGVRAALSDLGQPPANDFHLPIIDLGAHFLRSSNSSRWRGPYLSSSRETTEAWARKLLNLERPRIGLVWSGNVASPMARRRSITAHQIEAALPHGVSLVSLQIPSSKMPGRNVFDAAAEIGDWDDTAAVIEGLDLVLSVDTAVAHLAAAMGKDAWVLLHFSSDWRWGLRGNTTSWYPSMKLFRQERMNDWTSVIAQVRHELALFAEARKS